MFIRRCKNWNFGHVQDWTPISCCNFDGQRFWVDRDRFTLSISCIRLFMFILSCLRHSDTVFFSARVSLKGRQYTYCSSYCGLVRSVIALISWNLQGKGRVQPTVEEHRTSSEKTQHQCVDRPVKVVPVGHCGRERQMGGHDCWCICGRTPTTLGRRGSFVRYSQTTHLFTEIYLQKHTLSLLCCFLFVLLVYLGGGEAKMPLGGVYGIDTRTLSVCLSVRDVHSTKTVQDRPVMMCIEVE